MAGMVPVMNQQQIDTLVAQGIAAQQAQRYGEAERAYRTILQADPQNPQASALMGTLAGIAGRLDIALNFFNQALKRDPNNADLYHNIGETHRHLGDTAKALPAFNRAIELRPDHLEAYRSAADTAIDAAAKTPETSHAEELKRVAAQFLFKLGRRMHRLKKGNIEETFAEAVELSPEDGEILYAMGTVLQELSRPSEAVEMLKRAIAHGSADADTYNNLGNSYSALQRYAEMEEAFRAAMAADPNYLMAAANLASTTLMRTLYDEQFTASESFERHRTWGAETETSHGSAAAVSFPNSREPERPLRVAYLSGDFRTHSVGYFLQPVLAHHDRHNFEIVCYSEVDAPDATTTAMRGYCRLWRDSFEMTDAALRAQMRADRIDIAIDLAGQTAKNRLRALAVKAAPVTATWLGYPATTGLSTIDWRITDALADPVGAEVLYTEKLLRLEDGFLCYAPPLAAPSVLPLPSAGTGRVTFGSFNNMQKVSPSTLDAWAAILRALPEARLILKAPTLVDREIQQRFQQGFATRGVDRAQVELRTFIAESASHLAAYGEIDIALDPFPYNGTTTSCEAMWMGVPVVTLIGDRHTGRVGFDLVSRIGHPELAAENPAAYVARAIELARDPAGLQSLRANLRDDMRASSLCDATRFTRGFEHGLRTMWRQWCSSPYN